MASSSRPSRTTILLTLLLVWAIGLRVWYASEGLHIDRFWDEKFNVPNVQKALEEGSLTPTRYAYLRLTYLPQVFVLGALQWAARLVDPGFSWFRGEYLRPSGFMVSRSIQVLIGALSIFLTYILGRRLFSPEVGLVAALLVAASPNHLILSTIFKPDILVLTTTLMAFLWSLDAVDRPTIPRYLLAGLGIGLAMSSKPTAVAIAIPLTLGAGILGWKDRKHWIGLVCAGLTSVVLFLALNPYTRYLSAFELRRKRYNSVAAQKGTLGDPVETMRHIAATIFKGAHGDWLGWVALLGLFYLIYRVWRQRGEGREALPAAMLLSFALGFPILYGQVTQNVLPQNLLPLLPFTSLVAAVLLMAIWQQAQRLVPWLAYRWVAFTVALVFVILVAHRANAHAYGFLIPTTRDEAVEVLRTELPTTTKQVIRWESEGSSPAVVPREAGPPRRPPASLLFWNTPFLTELTPRALDRADAEVFPLIRLESEEAEFYGRRMGSAGEGAVRTIEAAPFHTWGPDLVVVLHPWHRSGTQSLDLTKTSEDDWFETQLAGADPGRELAVIEFSLPRLRAADQTPRVKLGNRQLQLLSSWSRKHVTWTTDRFPLATDEVRVRIRLPSKLETDHLSIELQFWSGNLPYVR